MKLDTCDHWEDVSMPGGGRCSRGLHGGLVSRGVCAVCDQNTRGKSDPRLSVNATAYQTAIVQLSRHGDILNILPVARQFAVKGGEPVPFVVNHEYASLVEGLSYVRPLVHSGYEGDPAWAAELAKPHAERVIITQGWGMPDDQKEAAGDGAETYDQASWNRAGLLHLWDTLPLILDNRDEGREQALLAKLVGDYAGPLVLAVRNGRSSPYPRHAAEELITFLKETTAARVVDISDVRAERFQDLCGLFERADALVATDTAPLHLSAFNRLPTVGLVNDTPWRASHRQRHWVERLTYAESTTHEGRERIRAALVGVLSRAKTLPRIVHVVDNYHGGRGGHRRFWRAEDTWVDLPGWRTCRLRDSPRSSADLGDPRKLPYLRDIFDAAVAGTAEDEIVCFTNSDIAITPEAPAAIREALTARDCCYSYRVSFPSLSPRRTRADLLAEKYTDSDGIDLFAFKPAWWRKARETFPDLLLGCEAWDACLGLLMGMDAEIPPVIYHEYHEAFWSRDENRAQNPGQKHNRALCRAWATSHGFTAVLNPPGSPYVFKGFKKAGISVAGHSYAQHHLDWIIASYFPSGFRGTFIEVGAVDGRHISNTLLLEESGWDGLCIEANPNHAEALKNNRRHALSVAVGTENRDAADFVLIDTSESNKQSSVSALTLDEALLQRHIDEGHPCTRHVVKVPVRTLDWCIEQFAPQSIDLVSIDVEGGELDVLKGFDINRWKPRLLVVESNDPAKRDEIRSYLKPLGFRVDRHEWPNDLFVRDDSPVPLTPQRIIHGAAGIAAAIMGQGGATDEQVKSRLAVCETCDKAVKTAGVFSTCSVCRCLLWAKVRNAGEHCPINKW